STDSPAAAAFAETGTAGARPSPTFARRATTASSIATRAFFPFMDLPRDPACDSGLLTNQRAQLPGARSWIEKVASRNRVPGYPRLPVAGGLPTLSDMSAQERMFIGGK